MFESGLTYRQIAKRLETSKSTVARVCLKWNKAARTRTPGRKCTITDEQRRYVTEIVLENKTVEIGLILKQLKLKYNVKVTAKSVESVLRSNYLREFIETHNAWIGLSEYCRKLATENGTAVTMDDISDSPILLQANGKISFFFFFVLQRIFDNEIIFKFLSHSKIAKIQNVWIVSNT